MVVAYITTTGDLREANRAAGTRLIDVSLYRCVQAHYISAPLFDGLADPLRRRSGVREGLEDEVVLIVPPPADAKRANEPGEGYTPGAGVQHYLDLIGGDAGFREPIVKAVASYVAIHGAGADAEPLKEAIRAAIAAADPGGRDNATLERYASDRHLDDIIEAIRAFQGDKPGTGETPAPPDYLVDPDIPIDEMADDAEVVADLDAAIAAGNLNQVIAALNQRYAVVAEAGKVVIFEPVIDPLRQRRMLVRITFDNFRKLYQNRKMTVVVGDEAVTHSVAHWWLESQYRRQFLDGVVFDPTETVPASFWNLWAGFAVDPAPGDWSLLKDHVQRVICGDEDAFAEYLFDLAARMFQEPDRQGEVAVVLRGEEGSGKGTFLNWLCRAFGQHGMHITSARHLTGNFNAHLRDCVMLFADEALFAGDKAHEGILKGLITEATLAIEAKYSDVVEVPNTLHVWMASNRDWVVPAALHARRFFVLDVADNRVGHWEYFAEIHQQMEQGGLAAMIHELLNRDISAFNAREIPQTAALKTQKTLSLSSLEAWWMAVLSRGFVWRSRHGTPWFRDWHEFYTTELLERSYLQWCAENRPYDRKNRTQLGAFFSRVYQAKRPRAEHPVYEIDSIDRQAVEVITDAGGNVHTVPKSLDLIAIVQKDHPHGYQVGDLAEARNDFCKICDVDTDWRGSVPE
jgi:hypothetical protein